MKRRMNNRILHRFLCGACLMGCAVVPFLAPAQTLRTSYFLESMPMRHRLNPALVSDRGYISIPAIGNINVATQSNVGLTAFLYPLPDGRLTTFMNPIVSAETFLGRIKNRNAVQVDADVYDTSRVPQSTMLPVSLPSIAKFSSVPLQTAAKACSVL